MELELATTLANMRDTALTIVALMPGIAVGLFALKAFLKGN
jgi:hypothetical protein